MWPSYEKKNKSHGLQIFSWKTLHRSELPWTRLLGFKGKWHRVLSFEKANFRILAPYLAGLCISPFPTTFPTMVFWGAKKLIFILSMHGRFFVRWLQIKGRVQNGPLQFSKVWDLEEWPYLRLHQFSWCACIYCIFGHLDVLNSNFNYGYIKYTSNFLGKIPASWCGTPETMHVKLECTVHLGTLSAHHRLDLDFMWGHRERIIIVKTIF
jgi:hypothetical protein